MKTVRLTSLLLVGAFVLAGLWTSPHSPATAAPSEQANPRRSVFPFFLSANNTGPAIEADQLGSGSVANFKDSGASETTIDLSGSTSINPLTLNGTGNINGPQLDVWAAPTQGTPPVMVRDSAGTPVASISGAGVLSAAGITDATGGVTAGEILDVTRQINIPLYSLIECDTDAGTAIGFGESVDALPDFINSATDGTGLVLRFDDTGSSEDQSTSVCGQISVPPDFVSTAAFKIRAVKDAHTAATEVINCAVSINGAALLTAGTVTTSASASTAYTCTPTATSLAAADSMAFHFFITSDSTMNDVVDLAAIAFSYVATQ